MPLKIQYCSDLHLEFPLNEKLMQKQLLNVKGNILILAGDIVLFSQMDKYGWFFDFVSARFEYTYWLPGNHEYYHGDIAARTGTVTEYIRHNVILVNNTSVVHEGVQILFSTLWSKINPVDERQIVRAMSDFHVISNHGARFNIDAFNRLHEESISFLQGELASSTTLTKIVVTHHVPTFKNYPPEYKGDVLNQAFATELYDFIETSGAHSWIYGHTHCNIPEFKIGQTSLLTNQLGYVRHGEHKSFKRDAVVEVG